MFEFVLFGYLAYRIAGKNILPDAETADIIKVETFSSRYLKTIGLSPKRQKYATV